MVNKSAVRDTSISDYSIVFGNNSVNHIYTPYTYLVGWSELNKYYYGLRYAKNKKCLYKEGCHPDEFWKTYFTSSKEVLAYRSQYGEPDVIHIRKTFSDPMSAKLWEHRVLRRLQAVSNDKWLNKSYALSKFDLHQYNIGKKRTLEQRLRMSNAQKGRKISSEHAQKISESNKGRTPWNYGKKISYKSTAKKWNVVSVETNESFTILSLRDWCDQNNINYTVFHRYIKMEKPYKGYKAFELKQEYKS